MTLEQLKQYEDNWQHFAGVVHPIQSEEEYEKISELLLELMDEVEENQHHPLASLLQTLTVLVDDYERKNMDISVQPNSAETLSFLMDQHDLKQKDLPEIGSQGVVSEILNGKRKLNARQIESLSQRFGVKKESFREG